MDHLFNLFLETAAVPLILSSLVAWQVARPKGWNKGWRWTGIIVLAVVAIGLIVAGQLALPYAQSIVANQGR